MTLPPAAIAIIFVLIVDFCIVASSITARSLFESLNAIQIVFYIKFISLLIVSVWIFAKRDLSLLKTKNIRGQAVRSVLGNINHVFVIWAFALLPASTASTLVYAAPIFTLLLSGLILNEKAGVYRWGAVLFGMLGVLILFIPTMNSVSDVSLFALCVGLACTFGTATVQISLRYLAKEGETATTTVFYFFLVGSLITVIPAFYNGFVWPSGLEDILAIIVGMQILSQYLKTQAYKFGDATLVAPFRYSGILWSVLIGFLFYKEIPTMEMVVAATIIVSANFVIIWRERRANKMKRK